MDDDGLRVLETGVPPVLAARSAPQEAFRKLAEGRRVLLGMDDAGRRVHPDMFDAGVISFAHGEGIRRPPPSVVAAGVGALLDTNRSAIENYLFLQRVEDLDRRIADSFMAEGIDEETANRICIDSGTTRLFCGFLHTVADPGDVFLVAPTFYHALAGWCELFGVRLEAVATRHEAAHKLTRDDLEACYDRIRGWRNRLKGLFLFNPTQTGAIYTVEELRGVSEFALRHRLVVLEDCIFGGTVYEPGRRVPHLASLPGMADRTVTVNGGSKTYSLANIRIGWGCGPASIIDPMQAYTTTTSATTPQIAKLMALAALEADPAFYAENARECSERAELICRLVRQVNRQASGRLGLGDEAAFITVEHPPEAGHSILLNLNRLRGWRLPEGSTLTSSLDVARYFLKACRVAVSPGYTSGFDACEIRLCFACVGLEETYADNRAAEIRAVLETVLQCSDLPAANVEALLASVPSGSRSRTGFDRGRALIETAFMDRILPALVSLGRLNARRFHELSTTETSHRETSSSVMRTRETPAVHYVPTKHA